VSEAQPASRWSRRIIGPFTIRHIVTLAAVLVVAALLLALLSAPIEDTSTADIPEPGSEFYQLSEPTTGLAIGQLAPELAGEHDGQAVPLLDLDGEPLSLAALRGRPVWLNFFASWCPPCIEETPVLRDTYATYADQGLRLVAVSVQETTPADVAAYAETYGLEYDIGFDATGAVFETYQGFGLPTHVFIDADGVIRHLRFGPIDREQAAEIIEPLLEGAAPPVG
jgi:thiol-disulfide isomerase/thioredoxin